MYTLNVSVDRLVCDHVGARLVQIRMCSCAVLWPVGRLCSAVSTVHCAVSSVVGYISKTIVLSYQSSRLKKYNLKYLFFPF